MRQILGFQKYSQFYLIFDHLSNSTGMSQLKNDKLEEWQEAPNLEKNIA